MRMIRFVSRCPVHGSADGNLCTCTSIHGQRMSLAPGQRRRNAVQYYGAAPNRKASAKLGLRRSAHAALLAGLPIAKHDAFRAVPGSYNLHAG